MSEPVLFVLGWGTGIFTVVGLMVFRDWRAEVRRRANVITIEEAMRRRRRE